MTDKPIEITLDNECTIYEVSEWQQKIISQWSNQKQSLHFNLANVNEMDASFVQLLLSCKKTTHDRGVQCVLNNIPASVEERFRQMHIHDLLIDKTNAGESENG